MYCGTSINVVIEYRVFRVYVPGFEIYIANMEQYFQHKQFKVFFVYIKQNCVLVHSHSVMFI